MLETTFFFFFKYPHTDLMFESGLSWMKFLAYSQVPILTLFWSVVILTLYRATKCPVEARVDASPSPDRFLICDDSNLKKKLLTLFWGNEIT